MTLEELRAIMPYAKPERAEQFLPHLNDAMQQYQIDENADREAAFLAQVAHESGSLRYVRELATGDAYEGRADLGNLEAGDGKRFRGRGLIQITGRANYSQCALALDLPLIEQPELLEEPGPACLSAAWFWHSRGLNGLADASDFRKITKIINGGYNGYEERLAYWRRAQAVLA